MILKMTNKDTNFYQYMGKYFGSRIVQVETNDRIFDDDNKEWYLYFKDNSCVAFVSICKKVIKNIYSIKNIYLEELLTSLQQEFSIEDSIVTINYIDVYEKCNFKIIKLDTYKNFIMIRYDKNE